MLNAEQQISDFNNEERYVGVGGLEITEEDKRMVNMVLNSNRLSYGPVSKEFERTFASLHDSKFGIFTNSGTSSLEIALAALKEKYNWSDGDEVLVPAVTFVATANVVIMNNLKPVFVDVNPYTFNIDEDKIKEKITERTRCIMPVHLLGLPASMDPIMKIAKENHLSVVEDSAETMFAHYKGRPVGSFGDISCFSTYVAHYIVTGVGGINLTSQPDLAVILRSLMNHGRDSIYISMDDSKNAEREALHEVVERRFRFVRLGYSYRATEMEAALGLSQLRRYGDILSGRKYVAQKYLTELADLKEYLQLPSVPGDREHTFMLFGIVEKTGAKRQLVNFLEDHGIETRDMLPLINQPVFQEKFGDMRGMYPVADHLNNNAFYIGCHQYITEDEIDYVSSKIHEFYRR